MAPPPERPAPTGVGPGGPCRAVHQQGARNQVGDTGRIGRSVLVLLGVRPPGDAPLPRRPLMRTTPVLVTAALVGAAVLVATPASAAPLACGSTVTVSTALSTDLTCPGPGPALALGAGVTLDLKGHTVAGPGTGI